MHRVELTLFHCAKFDGEREKYRRVCGERDYMKCKMKVGYEKEMDGSKATTGIRRGLEVGLIFSS